MIIALQKIINDSGITGDFPDVLDTDWEVLHVSSYTQVYTPGCTYSTVSVRQVWFLRATFKVSSFACKM